MAKQCKGCNLLFDPETAAQSYHSLNCRKTSERRARTESKRQEAVLVLATARKEFVQRIYRLMPKAKLGKAPIGYRLYSEDLAVMLPVPNTDRRDGSRPQRRPSDFSLSPVEIPISPLQGWYSVLWVYLDGTVSPSNQRVYLPWEDDCSRKEVLGTCLAVYRAKQKTAAVNAQAVQAAQAAYEAQAANEAQAAYEAQAVQAAQAAQAAAGPRSSEGALLAPHSENTEVG